MHGMPGRLALDVWWPGTPPPRVRRVLTALAARAARIGATRILAVGLIVEGTWALFGSLWLGLGTHTPAAEAAALPWAVGAGLLAGLFGLAFWLANDPPEA
jgi:hypothetical protein